MRPASKDNQGNAKNRLSSKRQRVADLLVLGIYTVKEFIGKWDQINPKTKNVKLRRMYRIYQGFTNGEAERKELFIRVFGELAPLSVAEYFYSHRLKCLRSRFFKSGEAEGWPMMEEYLRSWDDKVINATLDMLSDSL